MEPVRADVVAALQVSGYRVGGPIGRGASGAVWTATGPDGTRVVVRVLPAPTTVAERRAQQGRLTQLRGCLHPHLAHVLAVLDLPSGDRAVVVEAIGGTSLDAVSDARARFSEGEATTLLVPLAEALAELHERGLAHGDVSPANIVLTAQGKPVLVDLAGVLCPGEGSTPGYAAPERRGTGLGGAAGDVHALAAVVLELLGEPGPGGVSSLRAALARAVAPDPAARPTARALAAAAYDAVAPEPIELPDAAVLARASLTRLAASVHQAATVRPDRAVARWRRPAALAAVLVAVVGAVVAQGALLPGGGEAMAEGAPVVASAEPSAVASEPRAATARPSTATPAQSDVAPPSAAAPAPGDDAVTGSDPVAAARALTQMRGRALVARDEALLERVTDPDGPARVEDLALLARLVATGSTLRPAGEALVEVTAAREDDSRGDGDASAGAAERHVVVTSRVLAHDVTVEGTATRVEAEPPRTVVLVLVRSGEGWQVREVAAYAS